MLKIFVLIPGAVDIAMLQWKVKKKRNKIIGILTCINYVWYTIYEQCQNDK